MFRRNKWFRRLKGAQTAFDVCITTTLRFRPVKDKRFTSLTQSASGVDSHVIPPRFFGSHRRAFEGTYHKTQPSMWTATVSTTSLLDACRAFLYYQSHLPPRRAAAVSVIPKVSKCRWRPSSSSEKCTTPRSMSYSKQSS
eukprot:scaffold172196_cov40-Tisochrysis_lutea.AAC.1